MPPRKRPAAAAKKRPAAKEEKRSRTANLDLPTITNLLSSHIAEVCSTGYLCCISGSALAMASKGGRRLICEAAVSLSNKFNAYRVPGREKTDFN
jgi:hypothetical protein